MKLSCEITGLPTPDISWQKDGVIVKETKRVQISGSDNQYIVVIKNATPEDSGKYTCVAINEFGKASSSASTSIKPKGVAPTFTKKIQKLETTEGKDVKLECEVSGTPEIVIKWLKDGRPVKTSWRTKQEFDGKRCTLTLSGVTATEEGDYKCKAKNEYGEDSCTAGLVVKAKGVAPQFTKAFRPVDVTEGEKAVLEGKVKGTPTPELEWFKDGVKIEEDENRTFVYDGEKCFMQIKTSELTDDGNYRCVATNDIGKADCTVRLSVEPEGKAPVFVTTIQSTGAIEGEGTKFDASFTGYPAPSIEWYKDGTLITDTVHFRTTYDGKSCSLVIPSMEVDDVGSYKCVASNIHGKATCQADLELLETEIAPEFIKKLRNMEVMEEEGVRLDVFVSGVPAPTVEWFKEKVKLSETDNVVMEKGEKEGQFMLMIRSVGKDDVGMYSCVAKNVAGQATCQGELSALEKLVPEEYEKGRSFHDDFDFKNIFSMLYIWDKENVLKQHLGTVILEMNAKCLSCYHMEMNLKI